MQRDATFRVGIAGAGAFAAFLVEALAPLPGFQLTAVAARTPAKRQRVIDTWRKIRPQAPVPAEYASAESLIDEAEVDVVIIATPPDTQADLTGRALARGRHVFLEKPGALSAEALAAQVHAAAAARRAIVVDLVMRHNPLVEAVAQILRRGWLGAPEQASLVNAAHRVMGQGHWFWDPARSGGIFVEHGVHFFEVARHWFGEAQSQTGGSLPNSRGEHARVYATVLHAGEDGRLVPVSYYHGFTRDPHVPEITRWEVICERGRITLEGWIAQTLRVEGEIPETAVQALDALLDAVPTEPDERAVERVRRRAAELPVLTTPEKTADALAQEAEVARADSPADGANDRQDSDAAAAVATHASATGCRAYARTLHLPDRQGWYRAMVRARWFDLCAMSVDPNHAGVITPQDAVRDLDLAAAVTAGTNLWD